MKRNLELEATIVEKYAAVQAHLDGRGRRIRAAAESRAIGYGGDALVSDATGLSCPTVRKGRRELGAGGAEAGRIHRPGAGRPGIERSQPGIKQALERLVDQLARGDLASPLRWPHCAAGGTSWGSRATPGRGTCSSRPVRAAATGIARGLGNTACSSLPMRRDCVSTSAISRRTARQSQT